MKNNKKKHSIQFKFFLIIISIILFVSISLVSVFMIKSGNDFYDEIDKRGITEAKGISFDAKYAVLSGDNSMLDYIISGRLKKPDIVYINIVDQMGESIASGRNNGYGELMELSNSEESLEKGIKKTIFVSKKTKQNNRREEVYQFSAFINRFRITANDKKENVEDTSILSGITSAFPKGVVGNVEVGISLRYIKAKIEYMVTVSVLIIGVILFITIFTSYYFLQKTLKPIRDIKKISSDVSRGILTNPIDIRSLDEVGLLTNAFNNMVIELDNSRSMQGVIKEFADNIIKSMLNALVVLNSDYTIKTVNRAFISLLGYTENELKGNDINIIFSKESLDDRSWLNMMQKKYMVRNLEMVFLAKNRKKVYVLFSASVMLDIEAKVEGFVCVAQDITERKHTENVLRINEERYRTLVQAIPDIVFKIDKNGLFTFINPCVSNLGYKPIELIGKHYSIIFDESNAKSITDVLNIQKNLNDGKDLNSDAISSLGNDLNDVQMTRNIEVYLVHKNRDENSDNQSGFVGLLTVFSETSIPDIYNSMVDKNSNSVAGTVGIIRDISEKLRLQAENLRTGQLATLGELAASVAHEINSPLNSIIICAELMLSGAADSKIDNESLERIMIDSAHITKVVNGLLSFSRDSDTERAFFSIDQLLSETLILTTAQIKKEHISVVTDISSNMPEVYIHPQRLQHVFINLINNARYALNKKHKITGRNKLIKISGKKVEFNNSPHVIITFNDNGTGIPQDKINKIMNPFYTTKPRGEGTGLGLSICNKILKSEGGELEINSVEGEYTNMSIYLPVEVNKK